MKHHTTSKITDSALWSWISFVTEPLFVFDHTGYLVAVNDPACKLYPFQKVDWHNYSFETWQAHFEANIDFNLLWNQLLSKRASTTDLRVKLEEPARFDLSFYLCQPFNAIDETYLLAKLIEKKGITSKTDEVSKIMSLMGFVEKCTRTGSWELDVQTGKIYWSEGKFNLLEMTPVEELSVEDCLNALQKGEPRQLIENAIKQAMDEGKSWEYDIPVITAKGNVKWMRSKGFPVFEDGKCVSVMGTLQDITEEKNFHDLAVKEKKLLEDFSQQLPGVIYQFKMSPSGGFSIPYISKRVDEVFGYTAEYVMEHPELVLENIYKDDKERVWQEIIHSATHLSPFKSEYRIVKNGRLEWIMAQSRPQRLDDGSILWIGYCQIITNRKEQEYKLRQSEAKLRSLIENSPNIIFTHDLEGKITFISDYAKKLLAFDSDAQYYTVNVFDLIHPDDKDKALAPFYDLVTTKTRKTTQPFRVEVNGRYEWVIINGTPILDENNNIAEILAIGTLVTPLVEKEQALIRSEALAHKLANYYQSLVQSQSLFIVKTDLNGCFTYVNDHYQSIFGADVGLIGQSALVNIAPEDHQKTMETVEKCIAFPETAHSVVISKIKPNGEKVYSRWEMTAKTNDEGKVDEILCIGYDITDQVNTLRQTEKLVDELAQQNARLQNFAYIVSHNIRSHSSNLLGIANLIDEAQNEAERQAFIEMFKTSAQRLDETIQNLNEVISLRRNVEAQKVKVNLLDSINRVVHTLFDPTSDCKLQLNVQPSLHIKTIPAYLDSILLNIISNAFKYKSPKRHCEINITAKDDDNWIILEIQDNGLGIDMKKARTKLFGMYKTFHQMPDSRGLGLFMTKNQIEALGGKIAINSTVDVGTLVTLYFPKR